MNKTPKDIKRSIREKYKRRLNWLFHALDQYEIMAKERLQNGGNIINRKETEDILLKVSELKEMIPDPDLFRNEKELNFDRLNKIFGIDN